MSNRSQPSCLYLYLCFGNRFGGTESAVVVACGEFEWGSKGPGCFVLGDDDENEEGGEAPNFDPRVEIPISNADLGDSSAQANETDKQDSFELTQADISSSQEEIIPMPTKYYLNRSDTLHGLSLRFGVDVSTSPIYFFSRLLSVNKSILRCTKYASSTICLQVSSEIPISYTHEPS
jgi:hypothetical protein